MRWVGEFQWGNIDAKASAFLKMGRNCYKIFARTSWLVWGGFVLWCQSS